MNKIGVLSFFFALFVVHLCIVYTPPNQLTVFRNSATLLKVPVEKNPYKFRLVKVKPKLNLPQGPPVLFVHGHKGSVKQAIAFTRFCQNEGFALSMYSVDFKQGAVAVSHLLMEQEAEYINKALKKIEKLHPGQKIGLITHSMGGIVSSLALTLPGAPTNQLIYLIGLSSPVNQHPINSNLAFPAAYKRLHQFWKSKEDSELLYLSFTGGVRDLQVPAELTNIEELLTKNGLHFYTTAVAGVYLEADHLAMVWGKEFLGSLLGTLKIIYRENSMIERKNKVRQWLSSGISKMLYQKPFTVQKEIRSQKKKVPTNGVLKKEEVYWVQGNSLVESERPLVFYRNGQQVYLRSTQIDEKTLYRLKEDLYYVQTEQDSKIIVQKLEKVYGHLNFIQGFIGYKQEVQTSNLVGIQIIPGEFFQQPRFPVHISLFSEGQIRAMIGKCGNQQIVKLNQHDVIFYFHQYCQSGPQIWVFGFDRPLRYSLEIKVDIFGIFVSLARDLRLFSCSAVLFIGLLSILPSKPQKIIIITTGSLLYLSSCKFRQYGFLGLDHVHNTHIHIGIIDLLFLSVIGYALFAVIEGVFNKTQSLISYLSRFNSKYLKYSYFSVLLIYYFPWPVVFFLTLTTYILTANKGYYKKILFYSFLQLLTGLTQIMGWFILISDHQVVQPLNLFDLSVILPYITLLFSLHLCNHQVNITPQITILALYISLCSQDLLYRGSTAFSLTSCFLTIRLAAGSKFKLD